MNGSIKNVLVTGGSGFLGRAMIATLRNAGFKVRSFDVIAPPEGCNPDEWTVGSVADPEAVAAVCAGMDAVVIGHMVPNTSANYERPSPSMDINVKGTAVICEEARRAGVRRVVLISSISVIGSGVQSKQRVLRDCPAAPTIQYALTKHLQEQIVEYHRRLGHFSAISLRPAYVTDADNLVDKYQRQKPSVNWQFIDRRDVSGAAVAALTTGIDAVGAYFIHGHPAARAHLDVDVTCRDLGWTPAYDFSAWPEDAPVA